MESCFIALDTLWQCPFDSFNTIMDKRKSKNIIFFCHWTVIVDKHKIKGLCWGYNGMNQKCSIIKDKSWMFRLLDYEKYYTYFCYKKIKAKRMISPSKATVDCRNMRRCHMEVMAGTFSDLQLMQYWYHKYFRHSHTSATATLSNYGIDSMSAGK